MSQAGKVQRLNEHVVNILSVYAMADRQDIQQGMTAYWNYRSTMEGLAKKYGTAIGTVCGVFAALSPNATYASNLSSCESLLSAFTKGRPMESAKVSTYGANRQKAWDILSNGADYLYSGQWTGGKKTLAFFWNIFAPDENLPVVVDGHMYSIWVLKPIRMNEAKVGNGKRYDQISKDIQTAAKVAGILPSQMQAICWFTWKRVNRISFNVKELQGTLWPVE